MGEWEKPNDCFLILRAAKNKYSKKLIDVGSIKFNTPQDWVEDKSKGRGDILEGVFASCHILNIEGIIYYSQLYDDAYGETFGKLVYFRRKRTMNLPCYCFYLLKANSLQVPKEEGKQRVSVKIEGKYFRDFADNISIDDIDNLKAEDKPSVVVIHDIDRFIEKITDKLILLGLKKSEIMTHIIEYNDKNIPFYCTRKPPNELKIKDNTFSHQQEGRIIINTDNTSILEYLQNNPIEVGSLNDISEKTDAYLHDGMMLEFTADVYKIEQ